MRAWQTERHQKVAHADHQDADHPDQPAIDQARDLGLCSCQPFVHLGERVLKIGHLFISIGAIGVARALMVENYGLSSHGYLQCAPCNVALLVVRGTAREWLV